MAIALSLSASTPNTTQAAAFIVTNTNDDGFAGSLRKAITDANSNLGADTIEFSLPAGSTINLGSELVISDSVTIKGPIEGNPSSIILNGGSTNAGGTNRHINAGGFPLVIFWVKYSHVLCMLVLYMDTKIETPPIIEPFPALIKAVKSILYPFVHLLMRMGIPFPQLAELLKEVYIDVADKQFRLSDKKQTQTRLSFLTGIHRKDVKRLQNIQRDLQEPENISVGVKLVSQWVKEPRFLDDNGKPLLLPLKSDAGPSFEALVKTICKQDIRSRVVLDEWLNLGIVKLKNNHVELCSEAYIPKESQNEKAFFLGHNIADHLSAASQNLLNDSPEFFERCVYYDDLSDDSIAELQEMVDKHGMNLLKKLNDRAAQLKHEDQLKTASKEEPSTQRINIGLYLYHQNTSLQTTELTKSK